MYKSWIVLGIVSASAFGGIFFCWQKTLTLQEELVRNQSLIGPASEDLAVILSKRNQRPQKQMAKGVYLTAYSAGNSAKIEEIIRLLDQTELNAVVIDIKDYSGKILYDSQVPLVNELTTEEDRIGDVRALIRRLHEHHIYVIARQTVFQDPALAEKKPEWAIQDKSGGLWHDHKGLTWVDPTRREVWQYNLSIAQEAIQLGFDEINFDYVRFPSDGNMSRVVYTNKEQERYEVMHDFYHFLNGELSDERAFISVDLFGYVMERTDDLSIGQRLVDVVDEVDYVSPMMYPSHYPAGHLALSNPAEAPGAVIDHGMKLGTPVFENRRAMVRPWLQAFNLGAVYDADKIRAQVDMVEKYPNAGWFLWNASNRYSAAGLKNEET